MSLVSQKIPGLYDGVSQQPAALRFPQQCEYQLNCYSSLVDGVSKRPPTQHVARVYTTAMGEAMVHTIDRDLSERYNVVITDGDLRVFDAVTGEQLIVTYPNGKSYLNSYRPKTGFALVTIADYTFVVNKDVVAEENPDNLTPGQIDRRKQDFRDVTDIDSPYNGMVVEVAGDDNSAFDNYYVIRENGVWKETARPGIVAGFNKSTMPHVLVRESNGAFVFRQADWTDRDAGDNESSPMPSFIGRAINDVCFHRNRLGFVSGENTILSRSGEFFSFWRRTVTDLLDTDPVDVAASHTSVATLRFAVPFDKTLMVFADQSQFVLNARDVLSPATAGMDLATEFEVSPEVKPVGAGSSVFYPTVTGDYAAIREYYVETDAVTNDAVDVTGHVPRYVPADLFKLETAPNYDLLLGVAASDPNAVYVYRWYWAGNERRQSAWTRWVFPGKVLSVAVLDAYLYLLIESTDGVHIERMRLQDKSLAPGLDFDIMLDRRVYISGTYDVERDMTDFELPYDATGLDLQIVMGSDYGSDRGSLLTVSDRPDPYLVSVSGDVSGKRCFIGVPYEMVHTLSELMAREGDNSTIVRGRLQLQTLTVFYSGTGYFQFNVSRLGQSGDPIEVTPAVVDAETGRVVGRADLTLGEPSVGDGYARLPVYSNAHYARLELRNFSHLPSTFSLATWEGDLTLPERL